MKLTQIISFYHKKTISIVKRNDFEAVHIVFFNREKAILIPVRDRRFFITINRRRISVGPHTGRLFICLYAAGAAVFSRVYVRFMPPLCVACSN